MLREIGRLLDLHPLALADIVNVPQRPKVELYGDRLLFIGHMVFPNLAGEVEFEQVSIVLGPGWVVSFQEKPGDVFDPVRARIRSPQMRVRRMKADFLAYALVDAIVDGYFVVIEKIGDDLDALEDEVMERPTRDTLQRSTASAAGCSSCTGSSGGSATPSRRCGATRPSRSASRCACSCATCTTTPSSCSTASRPTGICR